jgi:hypothetical protein
MRHLARAAEGPFAPGIGIPIEGKRELYCTIFPHSLLTLQQQRYEKSAEKRTM